MYNISLLSVVEGKYKAASNGNTPAIFHHCYSDLATWNVIPFKSGPGQSII